MKAWRGLMWNRAWRRKAQHIVKMMSIEVSSARGNTIINFEKEEGSCVTRWHSRNMLSEAWGNSMLKRVLNIYHQILQLACNNVIDRSVCFGAPCDLMENDICHAQCDIILALVVEAWKCINYICAFNSENPASQSSQPANGLKQRSVTYNWKSI